MPTSRKAVLKYRKKAYDFIQVSVPKGEKEAIKEHAEIMGESLNSFIKRAIKQTIEGDELTAGFSRKKK